MGLLRKTYPKTTSKKPKRKQNRKLLTTCSVLSTEYILRLPHQPQGLWRHKARALFSGSELRALYPLLLYLRSNRSCAERLRRAEIRTHPAAPRLISVQGKSILSCPPAQTLESACNLLSPSPQSSINKFTGSTLKTRKQPLLTASAAAAWSRSHSFSPG